VCRIVVANSPRLFRQLVRRALGAIADWEVVGVAANPIELAHLVEYADPDWLIASLEIDGRLPTMVESLLARFPSVSVLGIALDGSRVKIRRMGWREEETLTDATFDELVSALRRGCGGQVEPGMSGG
jgi:DNA-binding NarL/FixJ family response regulator